MKESLLNLISEALVLEYNLPNQTLNYQKSCITHERLNDDCYKADDLQKLSRIVYESVLYYSYDQFQLDGGNHQGMFENAFKRKFKFNEAADETAKLKLGFYGEALLYSLLKIFYKNETLVCRGYFYDIQKKSEVTGYDCFHLIQTGESLELWFGETKFYQDGKAAVDSVFNNISKAISNDYLIETNFVTILQSKGNIVDKNTKIYEILDKWEKSLITNMVDELNANSIKLVYPILITYNQNSSGYDKSVEEIINHINSEYIDLKFKDIGIDYSIFFIFLPITNVRECKKQIIEWIDSKEPLIP
ncbi:Hachiman antiphage defense system protein HamA [Chryseobacterium sp. 'Rf worker isolate 10']|uniref:Hachiman antiphage defense system protein HamA n=1 Tax=Chryseobacterium sp. 'Rf worker isolate 10' TaxID=2887348 RepID=UPI003D6EBA8B